jgi:hypothetical protein
MSMARFVRAGIIATTVAGLAVLAPVAADATTRGPAPTSPAAASVNVIQDPGAEQAKGNSEGSQVPVKDWKILKGTEFTAVPYGAPEFPTKSSPGPKHRGKNFFAGGTSGATSGATQVDSLSADLGFIKRAKGRFSLSAWLGGYSDQGDHATLTVTWENAAGQALGHTTVGPVSAAQRHDVTGLLYRSTTGSVPKAATQVLVELHMVRDAGEYNDGYADDLSLVVKKA